MFFQTIEYQPSKGPVCCRRYKRSCVLRFRIGIPAIRSLDGIFRVDALDTSKVCMRATFESELCLRTRFRGLGHRDRVWMGSQSTYETGGV